jgi:hypothetical protein
MESCQVCGRNFNPLGFQVVVPELGRGFDRIECAQSARASAGPATRIAAAPLVAVAEPLKAAALAPVAVGAAAAAPRNLAPSAATLSLLAAGTAVAVVLWVRALGADPASFSLGPFTPPPAFGHDTVQAEVAPASTPAPTQSPPAAQPATVTVEKVVLVPSIPAPSLVVLVPHSGNAKPASKPAHPTEPQQLGPGKSTGKGHAKKGKGHEKHGGGQGSNNGHGKSHDHGKGKAKVKH